MRTLLATDAQRLERLAARLRVPSAVSPSSSAIHSRDARTALLAHECAYFTYIEHLKPTTGIERHWIEVYRRMRDRAAEFLPDPATESPRAVLEDIRRYLAAWQPFRVSDARVTEELSHLAARYAQSHRGRTPSLASQTELHAAIRHVYDSFAEASAGLSYLRRELPVAIIGDAHATLSRAERTLRAFEQQLLNHDAAQPTAAEYTLLIHCTSSAAQRKVADRLSPRAKVDCLTYIPTVFVHGTPESIDEVLRSEPLRNRSLVADYGTATFVAAFDTTVSRAQDPLRPARRSQSSRKASQNPAGTPWNLELIAAPDAWNTTRGSGARVAIVDTGVDYTHPELAQCFTTELGIDIVGGGLPMDRNGHGTHVAGSVAGKTVGVAPDATLYAVRVLDASGVGSEAGVLRGLEWAITKQMHVINCSLGSAYPSGAEARLIALAQSKGIAVVCAAGNDGDTSYNYPASHPGALSIAAVDRHAQHAEFSNRNDRVALCAPGVSVHSAWPGGSYRDLSGTSMATPHVSGACALLAASGHKRLYERLRASAKPLGDTSKYGSGLLNVAEAVSHA